MPTRTPHYTGVSLPNTCKHFQLQNLPSHITTKSIIVVKIWDSGQKINVSISSHVHMPLQ